jgi:hypothetical protein
VRGGVLAGPLVSAVTLPDRRAPLGGTSVNARNRSGFGSAGSPRPGSVGCVVPSETRDLEQPDEGDAQDQHESDDHGDGGFELKVVHGDALPGSEG